MTSSVERVTQKPPPAPRSAAEIGDQGASVLLPRLDSLTGLRFFAAYIVLVHHSVNFAVIPRLLSYTSFGVSGVSFFFVLSGFVLTWSFFPGDTAPRFYWRRFARIWPLNMIGTVLAIEVFYVLPGKPIDPVIVLLSLLLVHAWFMNPATYFGGNPASWSLSCEAFFYACFPAIVRPVLRRRRWQIAILGCLVVGVMISVVAWAQAHLSAPAWAWLLYISPAYRIGEFLLGVLCAAAMRGGWRPRIGVLPATALIVAWVWVLVHGAGWFPASGPFSLKALPYVVNAVLYAVLITAAAGSELAGRRSLLSTKPLIRLGQYSYALYLVHATVIYALPYVVHKPAPANANVLWLLAISVMSIALAGVLYTWVEHPLEKRLRRLAHPVRASATE